MIEITTREFTRAFAAWRKKAAQGETVRIKSAEGTFVFAKEASAIRAGDFLRRVKESEAKGILDEGGARAVRAAKAKAPPARSPWD